LFDTFTAKSDTIAKAYESLNYAKAMREIMQLADLANQFVDQHQPWALAKDETKLPAVQLICTQALNLFKVLCVYLKPVLPEIAKKAEQFLGLEPLSWQAASQPVLAKHVNVFVPLTLRVDVEKIKKI